MEMDKLKNKKVAIIGMGHMGKAIACGLLNARFKKENILISNSSQDNKKVTEQAEWIILSVKPLGIKELIEDISVLSKSKLFLSVAAGLRAAKIISYSHNKKQKIIRLMPNMPVAYGQGVIGLYANKNVSVLEKVEVIKFLSVLGTVIEVKKESDLESLTLISACGPAVVSYFISLFSKAGVRLGLSQSVAEHVALKTFIGTLAYLQRTGTSAEQLQKEVATKGGITEEIILSLKESNLFSLFEDSYKKGKAKIDKLQDTL